MRLAMIGPPVEKFLIRCDPANVRSAALARRLGFWHRGSVTEPDGWTGDRYELNVVDTEHAGPSWRVHRPRVRPRLGDGPRGLQPEGRSQVGEGPPLTVTSNEDSRQGDLGGVGRVPPVPCVRQRH